MQEAQGIGSTGPISSGPRLERNLPIGRHWGGWIRHLRGRQLTLRARGFGRKLQVTVRVSRGEDVLWIPSEAEKPRDSSTNGFVELALTCSLEREGGSHGGAPVIDHRLHSTTPAPSKGRPEAQRGNDICWPENFTIWRGLLAKSTRPSPLRPSAHDSVIEAGDGQ